MRSFLAVALALFLCAPAHADEAKPTLPTTEQRLVMLHDYAVALGQRFQCDHDNARMVGDSTRYTYALQFDNAIGKSATDTFGAGLKVGMDNIKAKKFSCVDAAAAVKTRERELRGNQPLMSQVIGLVATITGAAAACNVPEAQAQRLLGRALGYAQLDEEKIKSELEGARKDGMARVKNHSLECPTVQTVFQKLDGVIFPSNTIY